MSKLFEYFCACAVAITIALAVAPILEWAGCGHQALAGEPADTAEAIRQLQPALAPADADRYAGTIVEVSERRGFDPLLIVSMIMNESSFRHSVIGRGLEVGLMQLKVSTGTRFAEDHCDFRGDPDCNIRTGVRYLDFCRDTCPGSTWRWVAYYGMKNCPTEEAARHDTATRRKYAYYQRIGGTQWEE